ncbi:hypothetical protein CYMTET_48445 [Cymbomonas tetramitiformis]|uniref:Uncharacterized protein n=1 Tax=Cymbomonas tetramitiformis TaxID=36881 RepID=A0AAE0EVK9_9CHLO|nr:hypothetical protein CYMTET_48445 [Cymbomonas tetramitiformis]
MFRPSQNCSTRVYYDRCWMAECVAVIHTEYGCHNSRRCTSPFQNAILQVRHPLKTVASLLSKAESDCSNAKHQLTLITNIFPDEPWDRLESCTHKLALFWLVYNRELKKHTSAWYRVEETPPCEVASLAGFTHPAVVYEPHSSRVREVCSERQRGEGPGHGEEHGYANQKNNVKKLNVSWTDLEGAPYPLHDLRQQVEDLAVTFGYRVERKVVKEKQTKWKPPQ